MADHSVWVFWNCQFERGQWYAIEIEQGRQRTVRPQIAQFEVIRGNIQLDLIWRRRPGVNEPAMIRKIAKFKADRRSAPTNQSIRSRQ